MNLGLLSRTTLAYIGLVAWFVSLLLFAKAYYMQDIPEYKQALYFLLSIINFYTGVEFIRAWIRGSRRK